MARDEFKVIRKQRARTEFKKALGRLLKQKPYDKISVKDICVEADYSKSIFYAYFTDKDAFLYRIAEDEIEAYFDTWMNRLDENQGVFIEQDKYEPLIGIYEEIFNDIYQKKDIYQIIFLHKALPDIENYFMKRLIENQQRLMDFRRIDEKELESDHYKFIIHIIASAFVSSIKFWIEDDFKYSPLYLATMFSREVLAMNVKIKRQ